MRAPRYVKVELTPAQITVVAEMLEQLVPDSETLKAMPGPKKAALDRAHARLNAAIGREAFA